MNPSQKPPRPPAQKNRKRKKFPWWTLPVLLVCFGSLAYAYAFASEQFSAYDRFNAMRAAVLGDTFFGPVVVDGVQLTGLTLDEARASLGAHQAEQAESFHITLDAGERILAISSDDVPMAWNTESLLQKAYLVGRMGTLEQRYRQVMSFTEPTYLYSEFTYDRAAVRSMIEAFAASLAVAPQDAAVVAFDVAKRSFAFSDEKAGRIADAEALYRAAIDRLDQGAYGAVIPVAFTELSPRVTRVQLERDYTRIATFTTKTTTDKNRNNNIRLSADALNGRMIAAGGTVSFNEMTGERTRDKGYLEAGAIENGRTVQEVGGGVCQVSTTLFNALLRAGGEIVTRKPHAWPSSYVPRGEDATVDWPNLDLVMKNPASAPMFLTAWYESQTVTVEVYGLSLGEGVQVELESVTTYTKKPDEVVYTYNGNLALGTTKKVKEPRTGYTVDTFKITYQNGQEIAREKLYTSNYRTIYEEYEYNDGNPPA